MRKHTTTLALALCLAALYCAALHWCLYESRRNSSLSLCTLVGGLKSIGGRKCVVYCVCAYRNECVYAILVVRASLFKWGYCMSPLMPCGIVSLHACHCIHSVAAGSPKLGLQYLMVHMK